MNIKTVILKSGLEIIADVEEIPSQFTGAIETYVLNKPFKIETAFIPTQGDRGVSMIGAPQMLPMLHSTIQSFIKVPSTDVLDVQDTNAKFEAAYVHRTTGLALAR